MSVTAVSRRIYTVKKVYTTVYPLQDIGWGPDSHQIGWLIHR